MRWKIRSMAVILTLGALAMVTQAATTVLSENFESYTNGTALGIPNWLAQASNVTAVVTNDGSSLVGDFSGYALEVGGGNWDHNANLIGLVVSNIAVSGNVSPFIADYTLELDLEKLAGPVSWSTEMWLTVGSANLKYVFTDPALGSGPQHYSVNMKDFAEANGTFPIDGMTNMQIAVQYYGPSGTNVPDSVLTEYRVDNIQIVMDAAPFYLGDRSPTGAHIGLDQTISASAIDLGTEVDYMLMYLDGNYLIDGGFGGGSKTNSLSYPFTGLTEGAHNAKLEVWDATTTNRNYRWDFYVAADGPTNPVSFQGFESFPTGSWNAVTAPDENPQFYLNGSTPQYASIVDYGGTNQELYLDLNMSNMWQAGIYYNLDLNGLNASRDIGDYVMEFDMHVTPESVATLSSFFLHIYNADDTINGSSYDISAFDPGLTIAQAGGTITIPLKTIAGLAQSSTRPMDGSAQTWRVLFLLGGDSSAADQPAKINIDNMVVKYVEPPLLNITGSPKGLTVENPTVSATVYDGTEEVDTLTLYIDGVAVTNDIFAGGSTTNTISYDWIGSSSGIHTGTVAISTTSLYAETNTWTFFVPGTPPPPGNNPKAVYNINFEGSSNPNGGGLWAVTNGYVAAAPSWGSNNWYNVDYSNPWWVWGQPHTISDASGAGGASITYQLLDGSSGVGLYIPWTWGNAQQDFTEAATNSIWATALGGAPTDMQLELRDLDPTATYDLYLYFVCPTVAGDTTTTFSLINGNSPEPETILTSSHNSLFGGTTNMANFVENENYVIITGILPTSAGIVDFNVAGNPGGISAIQLVKRGPDIVYPVPNLGTFSTSDGEAYLTWGSATGFSYSVLSTTNLVTGPWVEVTNGIPGDGLQKWYVAPTTSEREFFKVEVY